MQHANTMHDKGVAALQWIDLLATAEHDDKKLDEKPALALFVAEKDSIVHAYVVDELQQDSILGDGQKSLKGAAGRLLQAREAHKTQDHASYFDAIKDETLADAINVFFEQFAKKAPLVTIGLIVAASGALSGLQLPENMIDVRGKFLRHSRRGVMRHYAQLLEKSRLSDEDENGIVELYAAIDEFITEGALQIERNNLLPQHNPPQP